MKLEHIAFNVPDPVAAAAWYQEHLGLRLVRKDEGEPFVHFLADEDGSVIEFYRNDGAEVPDYREVNPWTLHLAFQVDNMAAEHHRLIEAGAEAVGTIETTTAGDLLAFLRDPWGMTLQLVMRAERFA